MSKGSGNEPEGNNDLIFAIKLARQRALRSEQAIDVDVDPDLKTVREKILVRKHSADDLTLKSAAQCFTDKLDGD